MFLLFLEEEEILRQKEEMDANEGIEEEEACSFNSVEGVYPVSYFDLNKYTTHWKLVISSIISLHRLMIPSWLKILGLVLQERISRLEDLII